MLPQLRRLAAIIERGLVQTAPLWPDIQRVYEWVHRAGHLLANRAEHSGEQVQAEYEELLLEIRSNRQQVGSLGSAVDHFLKVTNSYWPCLFHCYYVPDLPQTNNDLEHCFGVARHHERRATGRKQGSATLVVRGRVRLLTAVAVAATMTTQPQGYRVENLRPIRPNPNPDPDQWKEWRELRVELEYRHSTRRAQFRFRKDQQSYLSQLEELLLKPALPF